MANIDVNRIANIIADIQTSQKNIEKAEKTRDSLQLQLEDEISYISDESDTIRSLRDELDSYLDELIPDGKHEVPSYNYQF